MPWYHCSRLVDLDQCGSLELCTEREFTEISVAPSRASSRSRLNAADCRPQALYLFVGRLNFLFQLSGLRALWRIVATQPVQHFADGEFIYFSHCNLLCRCARPDKSSAGKLCAVPDSDPSNWEPADLGCRKRQRQALLHWLYHSRKI